MSDFETIRLFIEGRVQGVGYRAFLVREANALGLVGWARNRGDGSVEAVAAGPRAALNALIVAARFGPPGSRVDRVSEEGAAGSELGESRDAFTVAPSA